MGSGTGAGGIWYHCDTICKRRIKHNEKFDSSGGGNVLYYKLSVSDTAQTNTP